MTRSRKGEDDPKKDFEERFDEVEEVATDNCDALSEGTGLGRPAVDANTWIELLVISRPIK